KVADVIGAGTQPQLHQGGGSRILAHLDLDPSHQVAHLASQLAERSLRIVRLLELVQEECDLEVKLVPGVVTRLVGQQALGAVSARPPRPVRRGILPPLPLRGSEEARDPSPLLLSGGVVRMEPQQTVQEAAGSPEQVLRGSAIVALEKGGQTRARRQSLVG